MTTHTYTLRTAARLLNLGPNKLFRALRARKVLDDNNLPYHRYVEAGYFRTRIVGVDTPAGSRAYGQALVTVKGINWLEKEFSAQIAAERAQ